jgi:hypothetical protein
MNWFGTKNGEGIEYHVLLLSLLLIVIARGSGAMSIDCWLSAILSENGAALMANVVRTVGACK